MASDFRPGRNDVMITRNDTWVQSFVLTASTVPVDLTGSTITIQIRKGCDGVLALTASTGGNGVTISGAGNNQINVSKLINIEKGKYVYDINVAFNSGVVKTYLEGDFIVYEDVTKP